MFADGRVEIHVPRFMRDAGRFVLDLQPDEFATLRRDLARLDGLDAEVLDADRRRGLQARAAAGGEIPTRAGAATSVFRIDGVEVAWRGLAVDARWLGDWQLQLLADLERRFQGWLHDPRRRPATLSDVTEDGRAPVAGEVGS
ncbi:MAG: hypothetical protein AAGM22_12785 [Acidobacteriota bacterium]